MRCSQVCARLDEELDTTAYADVDASENGLQVGPESASVDHVAVAVDAAVATIERGAGVGADLLLTHHGLSWGGIDRVTGTHYRRIAPLVENGLPLYVSHLPLDGHQQLGNAAGVADVLGLENRAPFGRIGAEYIGQRGELPDSNTVSELQESLAGTLDTGSGEVRVLDFGPEHIRDVAIVTGSGTDWLDEAIEVGADALVTGEGKQNVYHEAREAGMHVVLAGHYATETFGVRSLADLLGEWGLETTFLDHPTGL